MKRPNVSISRARKEREKHETKKALKKTRSCDDGMAPGAVGNDISIQLFKV